MRLKRGEKVLVLLKTRDKPKLKSPKTRTTTKEKTEARKKEKSTGDPPPTGGSKTKRTGKAMFRGGLSRLRGATWEGRPAKETTTCQRNQPFPKRPIT